MKIKRSHLRRLILNEVRVGVSGGDASDIDPNMQKVHFRKLGEIVEDWLIANQYYDPTNEYDQEAGWELKFKVGPGILPDLAKHEYADVQWYLSDAKTVGGVLAKRAVNVGRLKKYLKPIIQRGLKSLNPKFDHLKIKMFKDFHVSLGSDEISVVGKNTDSSTKRERESEVESNPKFDRGSDGTVIRRDRGQGGKRRGRGRTSGGGYRYYPEVEEIQRLCSYPGTPDGKWGPITDRMWNDWTERNQATITSKCPGISIQTAKRDASYFARQCGQPAGKPANVLAAVKSLGVSVVEPGPNVTPPPPTPPEPKPGKRTAVSEPIEYYEVTKDIRRASAKKQGYLDPSDPDSYTIGTVDTDEIVTDTDVFFGTSGYLAADNVTIKLTKENGKKGIPLCFFTDASEANDDDARTAGAIDISEVEANFEYGEINVLNPLVFDADNATIETDYGEASFHLMNAYTVIGKHKYQLVYVDGGYVNNYYHAVEIDEENLLVKFIDHDEAKLGKTGAKIKAGAESTASEVLQSTTGVPEVVADKIAKTGIEGVQDTLGGFADMDIKGKGLTGLRESKNKKMLKEFRKYLKLV